MKTMVKLLALLFLVSTLGSSCAAIARNVTEYEEEMARFESLSPEEKAEWENAKKEREKINWTEYEMD